MNSKYDIIGESGIQFFGKMSASIAHEIKNALAIINENAGLLEDLTLMAEKGMPLDPERLKALAGKIMKQIRRADGIVKNMSQFAHAVDEPVKNVDLGDVLALMTQLSNKFAVMRGVTLEPQPPDSPVMVTTHPFLLKNLVWLCLDYTMDAAGAGKKVRLDTEKTKKGAHIRFTGLEGLAAMPADRFPTDRAQALLNGLNAELAIDRDSGEIALILPGNVDL